jgi:hypothetical protein
MDAQGRVRRCLMDSTLLDLPRLMRTADDPAVWREFQSYLADKVPPSAMDSPLAMSQIGG